MYIIIHILRLYIFKTCLCGKLSKYLRNSQRYFINFWTLNTSTVIFSSTRGKTRHENYKKYIKRFETQRELLSCFLMLQIASATYRKQPNYLSEQNFVVYSATAKSTFAQRNYFWTGEFRTRDQPDRVPELTC